MTGPNKSSKALEVSPLTGAMGAEIRGVDLDDLEAAGFAELAAALYRYGAVVVRDQSLDDEAHLRLARRFGALERHPIVAGLAGHPEIIKMHKASGEPATFGVGWHSDNSFTVRPSMGSIVRAAVLPPFGGDTLFANQHLAYESLSSGMRRLLDGMRAVHSAKYAYTAPTTVDKYEGTATMKYERSQIVEEEVVHPVVRTHPVTGRRALYVNQMFTTRFEEMSEEESRPLLEFLFRHSTREDFQCRVRWCEGSVALWDNRCVQHTALDDCQGYERIHYRVTVAGEEPQGVQP